MSHGSAHGSALLAWPVMHALGAKPGSGTISAARNVKLHSWNTVAVVAVMEACTAAVLVGVVRLDSWAALSIYRNIVSGAWSVSCAG